MKALDISLTGPGRTGLGRYIEQLIPAFENIFHDEGVLLWAKHGKKLVPNTKLKDEGYAIPRWVPSRFAEPIVDKIKLTLLKRNNIKFIHIPFLRPLECRVKTLITVPDVYPISNPTMFSEEEQKKCAHYLNVIKSNDYGVVTISEASRNEIIKHTGLNKERITVIPLFVENQYFGAKAIENDTLKKYNIELPYLLFVGRESPLKNMPNIIKAYDKLRDKLNYKLILAGPTAGATPDVLKTIDQAKHKRDIIRLKYFPESLLPGLYASAAAFMSPSLNEGFGLPLLEAMASGTPVITASCGAIPEVCSDAVFYVDPENIEDIAHGLMTVLQNADMKKTLVESGLKRAKLFNTDVFDGRMEKLYRECAVLL